MLNFHSETHPQILEAPRVYPEVEDNQLIFNCEFKSDTVEEAARFHASWFEEAPIRQLDKIEILNGTERVATLPIDSASSDGTAIFRLGKKVGANCFLSYK